MSSHIGQLWVGGYVDGRRGVVVYVPTQVAHLTLEQTVKLRDELTKITEDRKVT